MVRDSGPFRLASRRNRRDYSLHNRTCGHRCERRTEQVQLIKVLPLFTKLFRASLFRLRAVQRNHQAQAARVRQFIRLRNIIGLPSYFEVYSVIFQY